MQGQPRQSANSIRRWLTLICFLPLLYGCVTTVATEVAGAALGAAMKSVGLTPPDPNAPRPMLVTLSAGELLNATESGESLSLVVRLYQLRNEAGFSTLPYAKVGNEDSEKAVISEDLVNVRELTLIPGKTYQLEEQVEPGVKVIGVVALFRDPAPNRWKLAFNRETSEETGIAVGFHSCAMTVAEGELTDAGATDATRSLSGIRCF